MKELLLLNDAGYKHIWCPVCEKDKPRTSMVGVWMSPAKVHVGNYGVCDECSRATIGMPKRLQSLQADQIEQRLIAKYPQVLKKLPDGYLQSNRRGHD